MDARIILAGQTPNMLNTLSQSNEMAARANEVKRQREIQEMYRTQGAGIAAGDQNAINALAGYDPQAALAVTTRQGQNRRADETHTRQGEAHRMGMNVDRERLAQMRAQGARQAQAHAAKMSAAQAAQEAQQIERSMMRANVLYQQGDLAGVNKILTDAGEMPLSSIDEYPMIAAAYEGVMDALQAGAGFSQGPQPTAAMQTLQSRAQAAGLRPDTPEYQDFMLSGGKTQQSRVVMGADGKPIYAEGEAAKGASGINELQSKNAVYATRAAGALEVLEREVDGEPISGQTTSRLNRALDAVPFGIGREMQSSEYQVAQASGQEFLQAVLRKDTGAAITSQEQILYGQLYLPQPGDTPETLEYRRQARRRAVTAIEAGMTPEAIRAQEIALAETSGIPIFGSEAGSSQPQSGAPDFGAMSEEELEAWISENG